MAEAPYCQILKLLGQPDWLLPDERVTFTTEGLSFSEDALIVHATLVSETRLRATSGRVNGMVVRRFRYTGSKSFLVSVMTDLYNELINRLRLVLDHPLKDLACRALNDDESLVVFMDAVIERGEIRADRVDVREQAEGFARSIVAPLIFTDWQTERWPFNHDLIDTGAEWEGKKIYSRGRLDGPITRIEIMGGMAIAESNAWTGRLVLD